MREWLEEVHRRLRGTALSAAQEAEVAEELAQHLEDRYRELRDRGAGAEEARAGALEELADDRLGRLIRRSKGSHAAESVPLGAGAAGLLAGVPGDVRFAWRLLRRNPGFALVATLTLALGIGANSAIFSVVSPVLLKPLPFADPQRLVQVWEDDPDIGPDTHDIPTSAANFLDWRMSSKAFEAMGAFRYGSVSLTGEGEPELVWSGQVTPDLFADVLKVEPLFGRTFTPEEGRPGQGRVVLLGWGLWQRRFGGDRRIVGRSIRLDGEAYTVVGVMPERFRFPLPPMYPILRTVRVDAWTPLTIDPASAPRDVQQLGVVGRLAPGTTIASASSEMRSIERVLAERYNAGWTIHLRRLTEQVNGGVSGPLLLLLGCVGLVLLIACANVANLLLARATGRRREIALRAAIGATRARILGQLLAESLLLAVAGGGVGLAIAYVGLGRLIAIIPAGFPRVPDIRVDGSVVLFTLLLSVATSLVFGVGPGLHAARLNPQDALREGGRGGTASGRVRRVTDVLVAGQVGLAIVLLSGAGLLLRSLVRLYSVDPGFRTEHLLTGGLALPLPGYADEGRVDAFYRTLLERVRALPGVEAVTVSTPMPFSGTDEFNGFAIEGRPAPEPGKTPSARLYAVEPDYLRTMGMTLLGGRGLERTDRRDAAAVVVINQAAQRRFWPGEDPIGRRITLSRGVSRQIVGIVHDVRYSALDADPLPELYVPIEQLPRPVTRTTLAVRTAGDPLKLAGDLRRAVAAVDPALPLADVRTMEAMVAASTADRRLLLVLIGAFAALALALSAIGLYGVLSNAVAARTQEMGVRLALGAKPNDVLRLVVGSAMRIVGAGAAAGLVAALALAGLLRSMLYGVGPRDPLTLLGVTALLLAVSLFAASVPARRATRVDPGTALRAE